MNLLETICGKSDATAVIRYLCFIEHSMSFYCRSSQIIAL